MALALGALAAMGAMQTLPSILQMTGVMGANAGPYKDMLKQVQLANSYAAAAANPNSKMFKAAAAEAEGPYRERAIEAINMMFSQDRRARARGTAGGIVTPERRDETRAKALAKAMQDSARMGRSEGRDRLLGAANTIYQGVGAMQGPSDSLNALEQQKLEGFQNVMDLGGLVTGNALNSLLARNKQGQQGAALSAMGSSKI